MQARLGTSAHFCKDVVLKFWGSQVNSYAFKILDVDNFSKKFIETSFFTSDDTREAHSFSESDQILS